MAQVFIINGHAKHVISPGKLTEAFTDRATAFFAARGDEVKATHVEQPFEVDAEIAKLTWADIGRRCQGGSTSLLTTPNNTYH